MYGSIVCDCRLNKFAFFLYLYIFVETSLASSKVISLGHVIVYLFELIIFL